MRLDKNYTALSTIAKWRSRYCSCLPTSRMSQEVSYPTSHPQTFTDTIRTQLWNHKKSPMPWSSHNWRTRSGSWYQVVRPPARDYWKDWWALISPSHLNTHLTWLFSAGLALEQRQIPTERAQEVRFLIHHALLRPSSLLPRPPIFASWTTYQLQHNDTTNLHTHNTYTHARVTSKSVHFRALLLCAIFKWRRRYHVSLLPLGGEQNRDQQNFISVLFSWSIFVSLYQRLMWKIGGENTIQNSFIFEKKAGKTNLILLFLCLLATLLLFTLYVLFKSTTNVWGKLYLLSFL